MDATKSGSWLDRKRVIVACEQTIHRIKVLRYDRACQDAQESFRLWYERRKSAWGRFWTASTFDLAEMTNFALQQHRYVAGAQEHTAQQLLDLATASEEDQLWVTAEDFAAITKRYQRV